MKKQTLSTFFSITYISDRMTRTFANSFSKQFILHYQLPSTCHWCQKSPNPHLCLIYIVIDAIEILRLIFVVLLLLRLE